MNPKYILQPSKKKTKKYDLIIETPNKTKTISFGAKGYQDYTLHHDEERKERYIQRHKNEKDNWADTKQNIQTPSYNALNLLWNKPTLSASIKDVERRQGIKIIKKF